ncbi:MAG: FAD-dependent oxidoreductase [Spirochaetia bacterium]|nr:FAD-dependent oxidoreductase [Spirochaetia bacterium]
MANPVKLRAVVSRVQAYGEGVYEVVLTPVGTVPRYKPGQFMHLTVDEYDPAGGFWPESRVFSIASAWGSGDLKIVYSVKGRYTKRMEGFLKAGTEVWLKLPYGDFVIEGALSEGQGAVLVAGGTGVSPFLPFLENRMKNGTAERDVRLFYGARRNAMLLGLDLITKSAANGVKTTILVEDEEPDCKAPLTGERGRLDIGRIITEGESMDKPAYFLSGPPQMIGIFKEKMMASGIAGSRIIIDEWE